MPSYEERSRRNKAEAEAQYRKALERDSLPLPVRIGGRIGTTGRYQVLSADGGVTSQGDKIFNSGIPDDGFVRGAVNGAGGVALDYRNYKARVADKVVQVEEIEEIEEIEIILVVEALVTSLYFSFYSGAGYSGYPFSEVTASNEQSGDFTYVFDPDTGLLEERTDGLTLTVSTPELPEDPLNSINVGTTAFQNFGGESGYEEISAQIVGAFVDHTGNTGQYSTGSYGYFQLELMFSLGSQLYLAEWDIEGEVRPILELDNKILELDEALNLEKRSALLTYLVEVKAMQPLIDQALVLIIQRRQANLPFSQYFGVDTELSIQKFLEPKLDTVPSELPVVNVTEEFFSLSSNMDLMKTALQNFIAFSGDTNVALLKNATVKCTSTKERADALQTFIVLRGFTNYIAFASLRPFASPPSLKWQYYRENWTDVATSPFEIELTFEGVPWQYSYGFGFTRIENDGYYMFLDVEATGIPFGASQYDIQYRWRKRGNTEWFSI